MSYDGFSGKLLVFEGGINGYDPALRAVAGKMTVILRVAETMTKAHLYPKSLALRYQDNVGISHALQHCY